MENPLSSDGWPPWGKAEGMGRETGRILSECSASNGTPGNEGEDGEEEEGKLEGGSRDEGEPEEAGARPKNIPETGYGLRTGEPVEISSRDSGTVMWAEKLGTMGRGYPHTTDGNL